MKKTRKNLKSSKISYSLRNVLFILVLLLLPILAFSLRSSQDIRFRAASSDPYCVADGQAINSAGAQCCSGRYYQQGSLYICGVPPSPTPNQNSVLNCLSSTTFSSGPGKCVTDYYTCSPTNSVGQSNCGSGQKCVPATAQCSPTTTQTYCPSRCANGCTVINGAQECRAYCDPSCGLKGCEYTSPSGGKCNPEPYCSNTIKCSEDSTCQPTTYGGTCVKKNCQYSGYLCVSTSSGEFAIFCADTQHPPTNSKYCPLGCDNGTCRTTPVCDKDDPSCHSTPVPTSVQESCGDHDMGQCYQSNSCEEIGRTIVMDSCQSGVCCSPGDPYIGRTCLAQGGKCIWQGYSCTQNRRLPNTDCGHDLVCIPSSVVCATPTPYVFKPSTTPLPTPLCPTQCTNGCFAGNKTCLPYCKCGENKCWNTDEQGGTCKEDAPAHWFACDYTVGSCKEVSADTNGTRYSDLTFCNEGCRPLCTTQGFTCKNNASVECVSAGTEGIVRSCGNLGCNTSDGQCNQARATMGLFSTLINFFSSLLKF